MPNNEPQAGGLKYDDEKPRYDLLDPYALEQVALVLRFGAAKYTVGNVSGEHNWRKGIRVSKLIRAGVGHLLSLLRGEDNDPETGLSHAAHAMCCCMFLLWMLKHRPDQDDRWTGANQQTLIPTPEQYFRAMEPNQHTSMLNPFKRSYDAKTSDSN